MSQNNDNKQRHGNDVATERQQRPRASTQRLLGELGVVVVDRTLALILTAIVIRPPFRHKVRFWRRLFWTLSPVEAPKRHRLRSAIACRGAIGCRAGDSLTVVEWVL